MVDYVNYDYFQQEKSPATANIFVSILKLGGTMAQFRKLLLIISFLLVVGITAGCGSNNDPALKDDPAQLVELTWYMMVRHRKICLKSSQR